MQRNNSDRRDGYDNKKYEKNHERIFGPPKRGSKMVFSHGEPPKKRHAILGSIDEFKSPITGEVISDRAQLKRHNRKYGVTDSRDYGSDYQHKRRLKREAHLTGETRQDDRHRAMSVRRALEEQGL